MEAGVDEVGRGPLAGPVVAAAVILPPDHGLILKDSKQLSEKKRIILDAAIRERALAFAIALIEPARIDQLNILQASLLAMKQAIEQLSITPSLALIDGNQTPPGLTIPSQTIIGGDALIPCISAASILAKVFRDELMCRLATTYPQYGFERHKGYPTKAHLAALAQYGITPIHRRTFGPVAAHHRD